MSAIIQYRHLVNSTITPFIKSLNRFHITTPLASAEIAGRQVYFKLENLQPSGSFKDRGIGNMIATLCAQGHVKKLISSSGGNAGHSVATIGKKVGLPVEVFVPVTTKPLMIEKLKKQGATVFIHGENWNAADNFARKAVAEQDGARYIPPYDDEMIWDGNASLVHEINEAGVIPSCIVLSVGGGGLLCGVQRGIEQLGWSQTKIIAVETSGAASFAAAKAAGKPVKLNSIDTIATSLGALSVTGATLKSTVLTESIVVSDADAISACLRLAQDFRILVEPACGAALAVVYSDEYWRRIAAEGPVVVVVCGGSAVSLELIDEWKKLL